MQSQRSLLSATHTFSNIYKHDFQGLKYRFRLINSGVHNCPVDINIDGHTITAIASDGHDFEPVEVDSLVSYAGERWDFVLEANRPVGNYWVRFTGLMDCDQRFTKAHQVAVLHYEGAPEREPKEPVGYNVHPKPQLVGTKLEVRSILISLSEQTLRRLTRGAGGGGLRRQSAVRPARPTSPPTIPAQPNRSTVM
ncbi:iron assimilation by reduction and transport [Homalodisca vitripennis]|nr:iron assimilation by reduction and transport [Homalodisca vitripennis]